jgi:ketosteroid isomerase-like protein
MPSSGVFRKLGCKMIFMKKAIILLITLLAVHSSYAQGKDEQEIRQLLETQVKQWNKGSVAGYMHGYWESDSLLFIGAKGPRYGYTTTLEKYKEAYPDEAHMGQLHTTLTELRRLSADYYFIVGKWALKRKAGDVSGDFTLLLRKIKGHWVIVVDHSS